MQKWLIFNRYRTLERSVNQFAGNLIVNLYNLKQYRNTTGSWSWGFWKIKVRKKHILQMEQKDVQTPKKLLSLKSMKERVGLIWTVLKMMATWFSLTTSNSSQIEADCKKWREYVKRYSNLTYMDKSKLKSTKEDREISSKESNQKFPVRRPGFQFWSA